MINTAQDQINEIIKQCENFKAFLDDYKISKDKNKIVLALQISLNYKLLDAEVKILKTTIEPIIAEAQVAKSPTLMERIFG